MSQPDYADLIERLAVAATDAREAVREAHEARRDLRVAVKEAREEIVGLVAMEWDDKVGAAVNESLTGLKDRIQQVQDAKTRQVIAAFDRLTNAMLRGSEGGRGEILGAGTPLEPPMRKVERLAKAPLSGDGR